MKRLKVAAVLVLTVAVVFLSMGHLTFLRSDTRHGMLFSAGNAVKDIEVISSVHHSVLHPVDRGMVRSYLYDRLAEMGGDPIVFSYDSVPFRSGGTFSMSNVYCRFLPECGDAPSSYIMLVAHLDSRFPEMTPDGMVCSYGAADDGYGLGVILELVRGALTYCGEWKQGLKVLFTDAEENELDGMRYALEKDNHIFDGVGLVVNVEARGVKGPALLFETSDGNDVLMDFYIDNAVYPYTYSLTSAVYRIMPNFTDFTLAKPLFPGYNFSVIDNLHYYHNDEDNFSNIRPESIAHYGVQLEPMIRCFLTGEEYSDPDFFRGGSDVTAFTIPGIGTVRMGKTGNYVFYAIVLAVFVLTVACYSALGRITVRQVFASALRHLAAIVSVAAAGTAAAFLAARISGLEYSLTDLKFLSGDGIAAVVLTAVMAAIYLPCFLSRSRKSENYVFSHLLGMTMLLLVLSAVLLFIIGENFFLMLPAVCALFGLMFHIVVYMNIMSLPALLLTVAAGFPFAYNLYTALTIGSVGIVMSVAFIYLTVTVSLAYCFIYQKR